MKITLHILTAFLLACILRWAGLPRSAELEIRYATRMYPSWSAVPLWAFPSGVDIAEVRTPLLPPRRARMIFAGDVMQHMPQVTSARRADGTFDYSPVFEYVAPFFRDADLAVVNLETTLTDRSDYSGYPCFRSPAALAGALREAGVEVCVLANNHCCDNGARGIEMTIAELDRCGIAHTGVFADSADYRANHPLRIELNGIKIALLNYTYGTNGLAVPKGMIVNLIDTVAMARDLRMARREGPDCVVVVIHWGEEYERRANRSQRRIGAFLRRNGVGVVIGSHPHVIQPFEADSLGVLFYSLGNFVSNQRERHTDGGLMARVGVTLCSEGAMRYHAEAVPVWVLLPGYRILTPAVADTMHMSASARALYDRFIDDTRKLLYQ